MRTILVLLLFIGFLSEARAQIFEEDPTTGYALVRRDLDSRGWASVIVKLNMPEYRPEGHIHGRRDREKQRSTIRQLQSFLVTDLDPRHVKVRRRYKLLPYITLEVSPAGLAALKRNRFVSLITADLVGKSSAAAALPFSSQRSPAPVTPAPTAEARLIVGADVANANGCDGNGWAIAILDSGIQNDHPSVAGRVVHEACFSTHSPSLNQESLCPNFSTDTTGTGVADDCIPCRSRTGTAPSYTYEPANCDFWPPPQLACPHGTLIAGPAVGNGGGIVGIAPQADIVSIKVMTKYLDTCPSPQYESGAGEPGTLGGQIPGQRADIRGQRLRDEGKGIRNFERRNVD